jgi:hypothetical protein
MKSRSTAPAISNTAIIADEILIGNFRGWLWIATFIFGGEPYEYVFDLGGSWQTKRQAEEQIKFQKCKHKARSYFLRDVEINMEMPN